MRKIREDSNMQSSHRDYVKSTLSIEVFDNANNLYIFYAALYGPNNDPPSEVATEGLVLNATYVTTDFEHAEVDYDLFNEPSYNI